MRRSISLSLWLKRAARQWLPLAAAVTALCFVVYVTVQQVWRMGANDPQIQLAEDAAARLAGGSDPAAVVLAAVVPAGQVDVATSLAPFLVVYDAAERPVASSGLLDGRTPEPPAGVLAYARDHGENRVTWQPEPGLRLAAVVVSVGGARPGYVLAARSLREAEARVGQMGSLVALGWLVTLGGMFVVAAAGQWLLADDAPAAAGVRD